MATRCQFLLITNLEGYGSSSLCEVHRVKFKVAAAKREILMQCKTSICSKSGSIEDRAVKSACSIGFLVMADQIMWPSSLSCDRKYTYSRWCAFKRLWIYSYRILALYKYFVAIYYYWTRRLYCFKIQQAKSTRAVIIEAWNSKNKIKLMNKNIRDRNI